MIGRTLAWISIGVGLAACGGGGGVDSTEATDGATTAEAGSASGSTSDGGSEAGDAASSSTGSGTTTTSSTASSSSSSSSTEEGTGETTGGETEGDEDDPDRVVPEDVVLLPPVPSGPILAPITAYSIQTRCPWAPETCELPIYSSYDRNDPEFWDILVDELLLSRAPLILMHGRGCLDPDSGTEGNGNMCPRLLVGLLDAIERAGAGDVLRFGMWDDTGAYPGTRNNVDGLASDTPFDFADPTSWRFFWDHNMKVWFDTMPPELWYRHDGHPVIAFWSLGGTRFTNHESNTSALLEDLKAKFMERYGEEPVFVLDNTWVSRDSTVSTEHAIGVNRWFAPSGNWRTYNEWGGAIWGAMVPGFRDPDTLPGCGPDCREVVRRDGDALREALDEGEAMGSVITLVEGWTDVYESAGFYRSDAWSFPNQYVGLVREYAEAETPTLRLQAEGADALSTQVGVPDLDAVYRVDVPNVEVLAEPGAWAVSFAGEAGWLEHSEIRLGCGRYRFTARVQAEQVASVRLEIDGEPLADREVTPGADYALVHLGSVDVPDGRHDFRLTADVGVRVDWFFLRRLESCP